MIGLNFYPPSVRYISPDIDPEIFDIIPSTMAKVGVFVNASLDDILEKASLYKLDYIQLHGDEDVDFCRLVARHHKIIKVFRIDESFDYSDLSPYNFANYYLFDTATKHYGGSGKKFDWERLSDYVGQIPFLLSGGIGPDDLNVVIKYQHPSFVGIDINSKFESAPGIKDSETLLPFVEKVQFLSQK